MKRYEFHTHSTMSDGTMLPSELVRRASVRGVSSVAVTDHVGFENYAFIVEAMLRLSELSREYGVVIVPGCEITHVPPGVIARLAQKIKAYGDVLVIVHGETPVEPVMPGTNRAAVEAQGLVDILAHPGFISSEECSQAAANGVMIEITGRGGHNATNGHVFRVASEAGCALLVNSDAHNSDDILDAKRARAVLLGCGAREAELDEILDRNPRQLLARLHRGIDELD
ncbi:MAG: histidinol phosphate phosphatase domain-containing protein [Candidatus Brocadiia bacterium]